MSSIFSDLNVRLNEVDNSDITVITDANAIKQSLIRLFNTEEGEIANFRIYGLPIKNFLHYPLNINTGTEIYDIIVQKINYFEQRVNVMSDLCEIIIDYTSSAIKIIMVVQIKSTGEILVLPTLSIIIKNG